MEHRAERAVVPSGRAEPFALRGEPSTSGASAPGFISVSSSKRDGSTERTRSPDALQFGARHRHDDAGTTFALRQWSCHCGTLAAASSNRVPVQSGLLRPCSTHNASTMKNWCYLQVRSAELAQNNRNTGKTLIVAVRPLSSSRTARLMHCPERGYSSARREDVAAVGRSGCRSNSSGNGTQRSRPFERACAFLRVRHAPHDLCLFPHRRPSRRRLDVDTLALASPRRADRSTNDRHAVESREAHATPMADSRTRGRCGHRGAGDRSGLRRAVLVRNGAQKSDRGVLGTIGRGSGVVRASFECAATLSRRRRSPGDSPRKAMSSACFEDTSSTRCPRNVGLVRARGA